MSYKKSLTANIKITLIPGRREADIKYIFQSIGKYYETAQYHSDRSYLKDNNRDALILSQIPDTLDSFDIYL